MLAELGQLRPRKNQLVGPLLLPVSGDCQACGSLQASTPCQLTGFYFYLPKSSWLALPQLQHTGKYGQGSHGDILLV